MNDFEPPIQNLDAFDIVGKRFDGGVDLVVVCSGPLDDSADTPGRLHQIIDNYLREVGSQRLRGPFGVEVTIFISCPRPASDAARGLISTLRKKASDHGVGLQLVKGMA